MRRREYLAASVGAITLTAGCAGHTEMSGEIIDPDPSVTEDGLALNPVDVDEVEVDPDSFGQYNAEGVLVNQVPLDVAYYWYNTQKARFIDSRIARQYENLHIEGAIHSPAPEGHGDDILNDIDKRERLVTYCTCPELLSGLRAGNLIENEYSGVYALEPGFGPWTQNEYQVGGNSTEMVIHNGNEDYSNIE